MSGAAVGGLSSGTRASIRVPRPRALSISRRPPSRRTRSASPARPWPFARTCAGSKPAPSSVTPIMISAPAVASATAMRRAPAWRRALSIASWAMR
jgi:hypothetical protein